MDKQTCATALGPLPSNLDPNICSWNVSKVTQKPRNTAYIDQIHFAGILSLDPPNYISEMLLHSLEYNILFVIIIFLA